MFVIRTEMGMINLGKYTLLKSPAFAVKEMDIWLKESLKNDQIIIPDI